MAKDLVLKIIMKANDKASAAFNKARAASNGLSGALARQQAELKRLHTAQKKLVAHGELKSGLKDLSAAIDVNRARYRALSAEILKNGAVSRKQRAEMKALTAEHQRLLDKQSRQRREIAALGRELSKMGVSAATGAGAQQKLRVQMAETERTIERQRRALERWSHAKGKFSAAQNMAGSMRSRAVGAGAAGVSIGFGVGHTLRSAMSEEDAMLGVIRQVPGLKNADNSLNHREIAKMRAEIQGLSAEVPMATVRLEEMYTAGARMDVPIGELRDFVRSSVMSATAFDSENPEELTENLGRIRKNFKYDSKGMNHIADVINYLDDNALSKGTDIIGYMNRVSGSIGLAKISGENVAALGSTLLSQGQDEGTSGCAVASLFSRLQSADRLKPVFLALKELGLDAGSVKAGMVTDAQATIEKIFAAVRKAPKEEQAGILKGLAGGEFNKVFAGLVANPEEWQRQVKLANSDAAKGSMQREFETRMTAFSAKWEVFKNKFFNVESAAGRSLFDTLSKLMDAAGDWLERIAKWTAANPELTATIMKVVAGGAALLVVLGGIGLALSSVLVPLAATKLAFSYLFLHAGAGVGIFARLSGLLGGGLWSGLARLGSGVLTLATGFGRFGMTAARALMLVGRAFLMNPIGLAITAAVAALYLLWRHWDKVKAALVAGWQWIKGVFRGNPLLAAFTGPIGAIISLIANWDRAKIALVAGWQWISVRFADNPIVRAINAAIDHFGRFGVSWESIRVLAGKVWEGIKSAIVGHIQSIIGWVSRAIDKFQSFFGTANKASSVRMPAAAAAGIPAVSPAGYSRGGYTGAGGVNEAAGIVHKGEVVFSQRDVARFGGWRAVEAVRKGGAGILARAAEKLGGFAFSGGDQPRMAGLLAAPVGGFAAAAAPVHIGGDTVAIHVHAAPGMSEAALVEKIKRVLNERDARRLRRANSSYRDKD